MKDQNDQHILKNSSGYETIFFSGKKGNKFMPGIN